jgi:hypothetical protein
MLKKILLVTLLVLTPMQAAKQARASAVKRQPIFQWVASC